MIRAAYGKGWGDIGRNLCTLSEPEKYSLGGKKTRFDSGTSTLLYELREVWQWMALTADGILDRHESDGILNISTDIIIADTGRYPR